MLPAGGRVEALAEARLADLAEIAERIKARIKRTTADVIATGRDLLLAQQRIGAGDLLGWVELELGMTRRWAQLQMRVAQTFQADEIISSVSPTFLYLLSAPSTPDAIRTEIADDLQAGRVVDHRAVEARIKQVRAERRLPKGRGVEHAKAENSATVEADDATWAVSGRLIDPKITALATKNAQKIAAGKSTEWLDDYFTEFERAMVELVRARRS